jgi:excisionase family DNA binding protein
MNLGSGGRPLPPGCRYGGDGGWVWEIPGDAVWPDMGHSRWMASSRTKRDPRTDGRVPVGQARLFGNRSVEQHGAGLGLNRPGPLTEPLLDARQAASLLNVRRSTVYELVRSRSLPHVRVGKRGLRFVRSDLAAWVTDNTFQGR